MKTLERLCRPCFCVLFCLAFFGSASNILAQKSKTKTVEPKKELYTLRYKPQLGTTLYDAETVVTHKLENGEEFPVTSKAQLVWKNIAVDLKKNIWTFDRYFSKLSTIDRDTTIKEIGSINKITRVTYSMTGQLLRRQVIDTALLSEEAEFLGFFFRAPRMMLPLPEALITYGAKWSDDREDTVIIPGGVFRYTVHYAYEFARVLDTLGGIAAIITSEQTGTFNGTQQNPGEQKLMFNGPITGADTTYLNLLTGRIVLRDSYSKIPVRVESEQGLPSSDILSVHSSYVLNRSNIHATGVRREEYISPDER
jgi:hypothetical protein